MSFVEGLVIVILMLCVTIVIIAFVGRKVHHGKIVTHRDPESGKTLFTLDFDGDPYEIENMKYVSFKVVKEETAE